MKVNFSNQDISSKRFELSFFFLKLNTHNKYGVVSVETRDRKVTKGVIDKIVYSEGSDNRYHYIHIVTIQNETISINIENLISLEELENEYEVDYFINKGIIKRKLEYDSTTENTIIPF